MVNILGPGTQAAQGIALQTNVNVADRPVTGQGMMGMKQSANTGRLVEDSAYYVGILRKRVTDITTESNRIRGEIDTLSRDSSQFNALERKYENLLKSKETLEGQLADYNLALDKVNFTFSCLHYFTEVCRQGHRRILMMFDISQVICARRMRRLAKNSTESLFWRNKKNQKSLIMKKRLIIYIAPFEIASTMSWSPASDERITSCWTGPRLLRLIHIWIVFIIRQRELQERNLNSENKLNEVSLISTSSALCSCDWIVQCENSSDWKWRQELRSAQGVHHSWA